MDNNWVKIFTADIEYKAEIARAILGEKEIMSVILNKKDSAYNTFGSVELYVQPEQVEAATSILKTSDL